MFPVPTIISVIYVVMLYNSYISEIGNINVYHSIYPRINDWLYKQYQ